MYKGSITVRDDHALSVIWKYDEQKLFVTAMKMFSWLGGVTKRDKIRNDYIRQIFKVAEFSLK